MVAPALRPGFALGPVRRTRARGPSGPSRVASSRCDPAPARLGYHGFMQVRRFVFLALVTVSIAALLILAALTLSAGGLGAGDLMLLGLFSLTTPWLAVGFWNSVIGLVLMLGARDVSAFLIPEAARRLEPLPITTSTAILMCVR